MEIYGKRKCTILIIEWYVVNELSQTTITSIIYDTSDSNDNTMYASTGNKTSFNMGSNLGGIYKSTNGGNTWTFINIDNTKKVDGDTTIDNIQPGMLSLSGVEARGSVIVVTSDTENNGGVFRSENGGQTWIKQVAIRMHQRAMKKYGMYVIIK